jgi:multidrug efflux pump subunit AcrA (membrane-fusion protein)
MTLPVMAIAMGLVGYWHVIENAKSAQAVEPVTIPARVPYQRTIAVAGLVEARSENVAIGSALSGVVLELYFPAEKVGQRVSAGTPLFKIDDRHLHAQLQVAKARHEIALQQLKKLQQLPRQEELPPSLAAVQVAEERMAKFRDKLERATNLVKNNTITREEYVEKDQEYKAAVREWERVTAEYQLLKKGAWEPDLAIAQASVSEAAAKVQEVETEIKRALVCAPITGELLQVNVRLGEQVSAQPGQSLMLLGDQSVKHVRVDIDEQDIPRFRKDTKALASPRGSSKLQIPLNFVRVEPYVMPKRSLTGDSTERVDTRVLQAIYAVDNVEQSLYVGQQLDVFIELPE